MRQRILYSNPNRRFRTLGTSRRYSTRALTTGGDVAAAHVNRELAELEAGEDIRQSRKFMREVAEAAKLVLESGDKRRRPRGVSKKVFAEVRRLKLTRTKANKKKQPRR